MNNHFNHISATEKLKAETLRKAKRQNWAMLSSIAAILVVFVGVSVFFLSPQSKNKASDINLYNNENSDLSTPESITIYEDEKFSDSASDILTEKPVPTPIVEAHAPTTTPKPILPEAGVPTVQATGCPTNYDEVINENTKTMYVNAENITAYDYASTEAPIKFSLKKGQQVTAVVNSQHIWAYVSYEENGVFKYGFVLEEYLSMEKP